MTIEQTPDTHSATGSKSGARPGRSNLVQYSPVPVTTGRFVRELADPSIDPAASALTRRACRIVWTLTNEFLALSSGSPAVRRDRRRSVSHERQIAMYLCHVTLRLPMADIGLAFGRDRTTVGHACARVEDRRDDRAYDDFVATLERIVASVFAASGDLRP